jgi:hypothetical protein
LQYNFALPVVFHRTMVKIFTLALIVSCNAIGASIDIMLVGPARL